MGATESFKQGNNKPCRKDWHGNDREKEEMVSYHEGTSRKGRQEGP
jgi:hypothetical protein